VRLNATDVCWYCNPEHYTKQIEDAVGEMVRDRGPELVAGPLPSRTRTDKISDNRGVDIDKIEELCLRVAAMQSTDLIGDASQLVKYCRALIKENRRLQAFRSAVIQCAKDHGEAGADYEAGGNVAGAAQLRAVQNLLWSLINENKGETVLPWSRDGKT